MTSKFVCAAGSQQAAPGGRTEIEKDIAEVRRLRDTDKRLDVEAAAGTGGQTLNRKCSVPPEDGIG